MRILCAWELGASHGHLARLAAIVKQLLAQGHEVTVALKDLAASSQFFAADTCTLLQAPVFQTKLQMRRDLVSLADVLLLKGYGSRESLWPLWQAWKNLITLSQADLLIADYAPTALLAAHSMNCPKIIIGNGFMLPETGEPLADWRPFKVSDKLPAQQENTVLEIINQLLSDDKKLTLLSELFHCEKVLINTFPLLDIYKALRKNAVYCTDNPQAFSKGSAFSLAGKLRISCYLNPAYKKLPQLCAALAGFDAEVKVICPGADARAMAALQSATFSFLTDLTDIETLIYNSDMFIGHGGQGTTTQCLRMGKAMLLLPMQLEQLNVAVILQKNGLAKLIPELDTAENYRDMLATNLGNAEFSNRLLEFSKANARYCQQTFAHAVATAVAGITSGQAGFPSRP